MSARLVPIGDVVERTSTWNPLNEPGSEFDYIDLSAVDQDTKRILKPNRLRTSEAPSRARQLVAAGDVLVSTVRPNLNGVAKIATCHHGMTASTGFCVLRPTPTKLHGGYLFQWVKSQGFIKDMVRKATGASYPAVSDRIIKESLIPLPPLDEQKRIAAILDKADELRAKRRKAIALLDTLVQSIFLEMFGDPVSNPKGWEVAPLEKVVDAVVDCPHSTPNWTQSGKIAIRTSNLTKGGWNWADTRYVAPLEFTERSRRRLVAPGDIVLSREGTIGVAAVVEQGMEVCLGQRLVQICPNQNILLSGFLLNHLLLDLDPAKLAHVMVGATSQHLNVKELRRIKTIQPPFNLQMKFQAIFENVEKKKKLLADFNLRLELACASLQHRAFSGQL